MGPTTEQISATANVRDDLFAETKELERMLANLKRGITSDLLADDGINNHSFKPTLSTEQRRSIAKSSWARSGSKRSFPGSTLSKSEVVPPAGGESHATANRDCAEKNLMKRANSFTIAKAKRDDIISASNPVTADVAFYDANVEAVSTSKRSRSVRFSKAKRTSAFDAPPASSDGHSAIVTDDDRDHNDDDRPPHGARPAAKWTEKQPHAYSFGKASRTDVILSNPKLLGECSGSILDVTRAERYLNGNSQSVIMRPPTQLRLEDEIESPCDMEVDENADQGIAPTTAEPKSSLDALSTFVRAPSAMIHPPTDPSAALKNKQALFGSSAASVTPGPGQYDIETAKPGVAQTMLTRKGKVYHAPSKKNYMQTAIAAEKEHIPGVGEYDLGKADRLLRKKLAVGVIMKPTSSEPTPHQLRKKYWEDKACDLREGHDNLRDANDKWLRPHTPGVTINPPSALENDWHRRMILRERALRREKEAEGAEYSVSRSLVEPRTKAAPSMAREAAAAASTKKRIADKPGVLQVLLDKQEAERARDKFYGPQLPVAWGSAGPEGNTRNADDSGDDSPTEDINRFLRRRSGVVEVDEEVDDTTKAYLRSSLAAPIAKSAVIMRPPAESHSSAALVHVVPPEPMFVGPQLPVDWIDQSESRGQSHKNKAIKMDAQKGRDNVRIRFKGEMQVEEFDEWQTKKTDDLGPGYYNPSTGAQLGEAVKGVPFNKLVSRVDAIGPDGERPAGYDEDLAAVAGEAFLMKDLLDVEFGDAKDRRSKISTKKGITLYAKERHTVEKVPEVPEDFKAREAALAHVGGLWFEGMAAETNKAKPTVSMKKMLGRAVAETETDLMVEEITGVQQDGPLDLEVKDWNPMLARPTPAMPFQDAEKYPRFAPDTVQTEGVPEHLGGSYFEGVAVQLAKKPAVVDMNKQRGRGETAEAESAAVRLELDGEVDIDAALSLAHARAESIKRGEELTNPKIKRSQFHADMSKQRGREEPPGMLRLTGDTMEHDGGTYPKETAFGEEVKGAAGWASAKPSSENDDAIIEEVMRQEGLLRGPQKPGPRDEAINAMLKSKTASGSAKADSARGKDPQRSPRDPVALSRSRPTTARQWGKEKVGRFAKQAVVETGEPAMTPRGQHFVDPDAGKFKKGAAGPMGSGTNGGMARSASTADRLKDEKAMEDALAGELGRMLHPDSLPSSGKSDTKHRNLSKSSSREINSDALSLERTDTKVRFQEQPMSPLPAPNLRAPLPTAFAGPPRDDVTLSAEFAALDAKLGASC